MIDSVFTGNRLEPVDMNIKVERIVTTVVGSTAGYGSLPHAEFEERRH